VINPDDVVDQFGADSLRLYEMFMGPLRDTKVYRAGWGWRGRHLKPSCAWNPFAGPVRDATV
jgi:leucyl-tRNA synthetase